MHTHKRGKSHSKRPSISELTTSLPPEEIKKKIIELAEAGNPPSLIGIILRDKYGVPLVKRALGKTITEVLREQGIAPSLPEDLANLIKHAVKVKKHIDIHRKDYSSLRGLQLLESKIRRLAKYYKRTGKLPLDWNYERDKAELLLR
ncbi:MAG: 30S ribosomal protein S15 [Candidatus Korarchaeota archaeon]